MVQQGKAVDKPVEIRDVLVLDPKVIDIEAKGNWAETWRKSEGVEVCRYPCWAR